MEVTPSGSVFQFMTGSENPVAVATAPDGAVFVSDWTTGVVYRVS